MKAIIIFVILISLLVVTGSIVYYYYYERPISKSMTEKETLNIYAVHNNYKIETDYEIYISNFDYLYSNGTTSTFGAITERVPKNQSIIVINKNLKNQNFYREIKEINTKNSGPFRVEFNLVEPGILEVKHNGSLINNDIILNLKSTGFITNVAFCTKWSRHIIRVETDDVEISKPAEYSLYDKCFYTNKTLNNGYDSINLKYKALSPLDASDYINLVIFDNYGVFNKTSEYEYNINY